jgi:hypothetical protein
MADDLSGGSSDDEQLRQQQAAEAAKAEADAKAAADAAKAKAAVANPMLTSGVTLTQPVPGTNVLQTPYGTVTGTVPAGAIASSNQPGGNLPLPYTPNPFTAPQGALDANLGPMQNYAKALEGQGLPQAAEAYRNLPANATPQQRAEAMQTYANSLEGKALTARIAGGAPINRASRPAWENQAISMAQALGKSPYGDPGLSWEGQRPASVAEMREARVVERAVREANLPPEQQAQAVAQARTDYRKLTPDEQAQQYYQGASEKPGGGWKATAQPVLSINQESTINSQVSDALRADRNLTAAIRDAKAEGVDEKGRKTKADRVLAAKLEEKRDQLRIDTGLVNPADRKAGLDPEYARQVAKDKFVRGGQSLLDIAKSQRVAEEQAKSERGREGPSEQTRQNLAEQEQRRLEHEAWLEQLRQRTQTYYSHYV